MIRKYIFVIIGSALGLLLIDSGFYIYSNHGIYIYFHNILLSLSNISFLRSFDYINLANKFFGIRFAPSPKLFGIMLILNGFGILIFVIITILKNKLLFKKKLLQTNEIISDKLYKFIILSIFTVSLIVLFNNFNGEISRINSFKQAEVASNIYFYVNNGFTIEETLFNKNTDLKFFSYPFYQYTVAALCKISGLPVTQSGRLINIFFFAITFLLFLKIFKILSISKSITLISIFLFAFSPLLLYYYRSVHPDPMAIYFSFLSLYYFLKYENENGTKTKNYLIIIFSGIIATLIKSPIYLMIVVAIFFYRFKTQNIRGILKKDFIIYAIIIVLTVVFYKITADIINEGAAIKAAWMFGTLNLRLSATPYMLLFTWYFIEVLNPFLLIFFIIGIYMVLKKKKKNIGEITFVSLLIGMVTAIVIFFNVFRAHDYYQLPFIIITAYFTAIFINKILNKFKKNRFNYYFAVFQFIMIVLIGFSIFKMPLNPDYNVIKSGKFIQNNIKKNDFVFYVYDKKIQNWDPTYLYHTKREGFNLSLNNLKKKEYVKNIINKYKNINRGFFVFIPNEFQKDFNIEKIPIRLIIFKKDSIGNLYKIN